MSKRKKTIRLILGGFLLILIVLIGVYWDLLNYGLLQGRGQLKILWNARPVEEVLADTSTSKETVEKLLLIDRIRSYAMDSLGLNNSKNYTTFYDQGGKPILWVVTASDRYALNPYQWRFPVVGTVPYKGYFDLEKTKQLGQKLKDEGYDVYIREVGGWSTLGWFTDPILSGMLDRGIGDIANLIIHELTHSTVFVKDSITFNENLASFIGHHGALKFLESEYGLESEEYHKYQSSKSDSYRFSNHFINGAISLDSLYSSLTGRTDSTNLDSIKNEHISRVISNLDTVAFVDTLRYRKVFSDWIPNNAWFLSFRRYRGENENLERLLEYQYQGDIRILINDMKSKYPYL